MRVLLAPMLLASLLIGCGNVPGAPTEVTHAVLAARAAASLRADQALPIAGSCVLTFNAPPFPIPPIITQTDVGECSISHLGHSTVIGVQTINPGAGTQAGQRTYTAANGDRLEMTHVGTSGPVGPGLVRFQSTATIVGGTGRFASATGQVRQEGIANLLTRTSTASFEGTISYDASDRGRQ